MRNAGSIRAERNFRQQIAGNIVTRRVYELFAIFVMIIMLLPCVIFAISHNKAKPEQASALCFEDNDYIYIDVIGISDCFYKRTSINGKQNFYIAKAKDGSRYIFKMTPKDHRKLKDQNTWWNSIDMEHPPAPKRVYGRLLNLSSDRIKELSETLYITEEDFKNWFGTQYIDVKNGID